MLAPQDKLASYAPQSLLQRIAANSEIWQTPLQKPIFQRRNSSGTRAVGLISLIKKEIPESSEILACRYDRSEVWEKAMYDPVKSRQKTQQAYLNTETISHYNSALVACEEQGDAADSNTLIEIYAGLGQAHFLSSEFQPSIAAYQKMLEVSRDRGDRKKEAEALYNISYSSFWAHDFDAASEYARQAYNLALEIDCKNIQAASQFVTGYLYGVTARLDESVEYFDRGINLSQETGDREREAFNTFMLGLVHNWKGEYETAEELADRGVAIGRDDNSLLVWMMNLWKRGLTRGGKGEYSGAFADLEKARNLSDRLGDKVWKSRILNTLGWLYGELYNIDSAVLYNHDGLRTAWRQGDPEIIRNAAINLGDCYLLKEDLPTAGSFLRMVYRDSQKSGKWGEEWMKWRYLQRCCHSLGELKLLQGDAESALRLAQECLQLAQPTKTRKNIIKGWRLMGQAHLDRGNIKLAGEYLERAIALAQEIGNPPQLWKTHAAIGDLHCQCDRTKLATTAYREAVRAIEETASRLQCDRIKQTFLASQPVQEIRQKLEKF